MNQQLHELIARYVQKGILIDTNILLLYFIGSFDPNLISNFKRTIQFTVEDYKILLLLLRPFEKLITTPNILTEVSNLSGQLGEPARTSYFQVFAEKIALLEEHYIHSHEAAAQEDFLRFGLTDTNTFNLSKDQYLVLTDDFRLSQCLQKKDIDAINFNHIRVLGSIIFGYLDGHKALTESASRTIEDAFDAQEHL
ncbi:MAG TPA: PIN domain-containing protein [Blastocatellia bacterium]|nr:PIN domain-containing protein [Blastocatellia bacterium]